MSDKLTNSTDIKTNSFTVGMNKNNTNFFIKEGMWTHALNLINIAHEGEAFAVNNEQSNELCASAPYDIIGFAHIFNGRFVIFSTNDTDSEIGIFDQDKCEYTVVVNDPCLNFKKTNLITAVVKKNYDNTYSTYFQDNLNYDRVLNLDRVPYKEIGNLSPDPDCYIPEYSDELDCDKIRLNPPVNQPCILTRKSLSSGQLLSGTYQAFIAYSENNIRLTDYSMPSNPVSIFDHTGVAGSIEIEISDLDLNYEEYELVVVSTINQQTIAKKIGYYSTRQNKIILDNYNQSLETIPLADLPLKTIVYDKSEKIFNVGDYLLRQGLTGQPKVNYQPFASQIKTNWVAVEYPADYYFNSGTDVGYMRDEVYAFMIRWVYDTGARTESYLIVGREERPGDKDPVTGNDIVYSYEQERWQVYDTATINPATGTTPNGGTIIAKGLMSYHESTELFPDNQSEVYGDLCGKPIRHHKMPSNETIHIHSSNGEKIVVLGVEFTNIHHPLDNNGKPIQNIVGFEILRASREGNKSIVAKGMFNNMWEYDIEGNPTKKGLYQNYPYNDLRPDNFLTTDRTTLDTGSGNTGEINAAPSPATYLREYLSFHSPDTTFLKPYLSGNYIKIYTEERGTVTGNYELPYKHPKFKVLTTASFLLSFAIGSGIALLSAFGKQNSVSGNYPLVAATGGPFFSYSRESSVGTVVSDFALGTALAGSPLGLGYNTAATVLGTVNLVAGWVYYLGEGIDQVLSIIAKLAKYRDFALQYNSHGFYDNYAAVTSSDAPVGVRPTHRRLVADSGAKYIGSGIQNFDNNYIINNLNRNKYVAVKTTFIVPPPVGTDNTRQRVRDNAAISHTSPFGVFNSNTAAYYGAIKVPFRNQYGQLSNLIHIPINSCVINTTPRIGFLYKTDVLFGGDIYINRYTEKNPYYFFNTWLTDVIDGLEFNYRNYVNGPVPRYWLDSNLFDITDFNVTFSGLVPSVTTPASFHRLDRPVLNTGIFSLRNCWFYLFCNGVRDFFVESEINLAFRDYGEDDSDKFYDPYGNVFTDLSYMFRSDLITRSIFYKYDLSLSVSKLFNNFASWSKFLPADYSPSDPFKQFDLFERRVVYSLPHKEGMRRDSWRNFLPLNFRDFIGKINTIKPFNVNGAIILFEDQEPVLFTGVDTLQTEKGVKITIGDGGLFQQNNQSVVNADDAFEYGACISSRSAVNTPYGLFFVSQNSGKIFKYASNLQDIGLVDMQAFFSENLPSKLLEQYPDYPYYDNPVIGIGVQAIYDPQKELIYFTKKDYKALHDDLYFDDPTGVPYRRCNPEPSEDPNLGVVEDNGGGGLSVDCDGPMDVVIALDITGSMIASVTEFKLSVNSIVQEIQDKSGNDYRIGYMTISEEPGGPAVNTPVVSFSQNNGVAVINAVIATTMTSGGDTPEPSDLALKNILDGGLGAFRPNASKIIILITDAPPSRGTDIYDPVSSAVFRQQIINQAVAQDVKIFTVTTGFAASDPGPLATEVRAIMQEYAEETFGDYFLSPTGAVSGLILDSIDAVTCPTQCSLTTTKYTIVAGETITLTWETINASSVTLTDFGSVPFNGTVTFAPSESKLYELTATGPTGNSICPVEIRVLPFAKCPCPYDDPTCFEKCNWTISYDPKRETWISFHSWHPDLLMPAVKNFYSILNNQIWRHNYRLDSFCNFYGVNYPFLVEYPVTTPNNVTTVRCLEYTLEAYRYFNDRKDKQHSLDQNFDKIIIHNSEQVSGELRLFDKPKNSPAAGLVYPIFNTNFIEVLAYKEENRYRINQFYDITANRGEFTLTDETIWLTDCSGVNRVLNPDYLNYNKSKLELKKFRHNGNKVVFIKQVSGAFNFILKLANTKLLNSPR